MVGRIAAYSPSYVGAAYFGAVKNVQASNKKPGAVTPVKAVPEVFSNADTERMRKTPDEKEQERNVAFDMMKAGAMRNQENLNGIIL